MSNSKYEYIFFDLDRTLWDFNKNSEKSLNLIFKDYDLKAYFGSFLHFKSRFYYHNSKLWTAYYQQRIKREDLFHKRFLLCLKESGLNNPKLAHKISFDFMDISPMQTHTFPNTFQTLNYLQECGYKLSVITNGFTNIQSKKLKNSKLDKYISTLITSEDANANKPDEKIFQFALNLTGATPLNSIMIGDDLATDIQGAKQMNIDQVYFNPKRVRHSKNPTYEISDLLELKKIL